MSSDLRTDDEIARLFADANPIPNDRDAGGRTSSRAQEWTEIALGEHRPNPVSSTVEREQHPARWLLAAAAAAVLVVGAAVVTLGQDDRAAVDGSTSDASSITTPDTLPPTRLQVVEAFVQAVSAHDAARANRQLLPDVVPAVAPGADVGVDAPASLADQLAWLEAFDWTWRLESCRQNGDVGAECTVRQRNRLSDLVGLDFSARLLIGFEGGRIEGLIVTHTLDEYGPQAFRPFYRWVAEQSPDDADRLWSPETRKFLPPIITQDTAALMDAYLTEYTTAYDDIQAATAADVEAAGAFVDAFNARDEKALTSLSADVQAIAADLFGASDLATSLAWHDALDVRWTERHCADEDENSLALQSSHSIVCRVVERNALTEAAGVEVPTVLRFSIVDGIVDEVNILSDGGDLAVRALEPFVEWVAATYPQDLRAMWSLPAANRWISPIQSDATIPLFEAHVDEWTSGAERPIPAHRRFLAAVANGDVGAVSTVLAPGATVEVLWAASADDLRGLSLLLERLEWSWNVESCGISRDDPDAARPEITCVAAPTSRLEAGGIALPPMVMGFAFTSDGIAAVSTGPWLDRTAADLAPLFDWIRTTHPDEAAALLADRAGVTVPVLTVDAATRFVELVDDYLATIDG